MSISANTVGGTIRLQKSQRVLFIATTFVPPAGTAPNREQDLNAFYSHVDGTPCGDGQRTSGLPTLDLEDS